MRTPFYISFTLLLILIAGACTQESRQADSTEDPSEGNQRQTYNDVINDIAKRIEDCTLVSGNTERGDMRSDYKAYFDGEELVFIHEHVNLGKFGYSVNRYYFHEDKLLYYDEDKLSKGSSEDGSPVTRVIVSWMVFDPDGSVIQAEKRVDGKSRAPENDESTEVMKNVQYLISLLDS